MSVSAGSLASAGGDREPPILFAAAEPRHAEGAGAAGAHAPAPSASTSATTIEHGRLRESGARRADWKLLGPYVSLRAWGTVREDYSADGDAWNHCTHDMARSRAYRWSEDGIGGVCNRFQNFVASVALWNGVDPILKERMFGVTNGEGNHGECHAASTCKHTRAWRRLISRRRRRRRAG